MSHSVDEHYDVYRERRVRARRAHVCDACEETIAALHHYYRVSWVWDGSAESVKRCLKCQAIHDHLKDVASYADAWPDERLACGEEYEEHWGRPPPDDVAKLAFMTAEEAQAELVPA